MAVSLIPNVLGFQRLYCLNLRPVKELRGTILDTGPFFQQLFISSANGELRGRELLFRIRTLLLIFTN